MQNGIPFSILLVDDDEDDRQVMDEAFLEIGFAAEVKKFRDGKMLLHYLQTVEASLYPSLIVLDNSLPLLDASDLLDILKADPAYSNIPVVVYTNALTASKKEQLRAAGAHACFEKGNTMQAIIELAKQFKALSAQHRKEA